MVQEEEHNIDFRVPGLPHSVVKEAEHLRVQELVQRIENHPHRVKSTSPDTENHYKNGYVNNKNFIMTNVDINSDTKYTIDNDTNNHNAHNLHK